jgi:hypothetical protein
MDDLISGLNSIPLSGNDLTMMSSKLGKPSHFIEYNELQGKTLESLDTPLYILFDIISRTGKKEPIGHWAVLMKDPLIYYDPYALSISQDLKITNEPPYLEQILAGHQVDVNKFRHQRFRDETNTCGRYVVVRSLFPLSNSEYDAKVMRGVKGHVDNLDTFVSLTTAFLSDSDKIQRFF